MELVRELPARRRIGVLAAPGDRRDDDIRAVGRLAAGLDHVIVKEDDDRRGRERGATAALVVEGCVKLCLAGSHRDRAFRARAVDRAVSLLETNASRSSWSTMCVACSKRCGTPHV